MPVPGVAQGCWWIAKSATTTRSCALSVSRLEAAQFVEFIAIGFWRVRRVASRGRKSGHLREGGALDGYKGPDRVRLRRLKNQ